MMYFNYKTKKEKGFSLVEVLVATSVLLITIVGPMGLVNRINNTDRFSNENSVATLLAQEGVELAQAARDYRMLSYFNNVFYNNGNSNPANCNGANAVLCPWNSYLNDTQFASCISNNGCGIHVTSGHALTARNCGATAANCRVYERTNFAAGQRTIYSHDSATHAGETPYTRVIRFYPEYDTTRSPNRVISVRVESTVTWRTGSLLASQEVKATGFLFNVYDTR